MVFSSTLIHAHPAIHPSIFFLISNSQFIHSHDYIIRLIHSSSKLITPHYLSSTRRSRSLNAKLSGTFSLNFFFRNSSNSSNFLNKGEFFEFFFFFVLLGSATRRDFRCDHHREARRSQAQQSLWKQISKEGNEGNGSEGKEMNE